MDQILNKAVSHLNDNCIITGGHFRIFNKDNYRENLNQGTIKSFELAVLLYIIAKNKGIKPDIGILINDMGSPCNENGCNIKTIKFSRDDYNLPNEYKKILISNGLEESNLKIYWEKNIRNKSKKIFLKIIKKK